MRPGWLYVVLALVAILGAYSNTFHSPFVFDDEVNILKNASIERIGSAFSAPAHSGVAGRPLSNLLFAVNYSISGREVWSYHVVNLALHLAACVFAFLLVRDAMPFLARERALRCEPRAVAFFAALLWALHPVQTETVTYLSQRTEAAMGICYLFALWAFLRARQGNSMLWSTLSIAACITGALFKEVIATAPLAILALDFFLVRAPWKEIRGRWLFYVGLSGTWVVVLWSLSQYSAGNIGMGSAVTPHEYLLISVGSWLTYLRVTFFPWPLVFDYGIQRVSDFREVVLKLAPLAGLGMALLWLLIRRSRYALLPLLFVIVLVPSTSVIPIAGQPTAEHRLYLPLLSATVAVVLFLARGGVRILAGVGTVLGVTLAVMTFVRNQDYATEERLWRDTAEKIPRNARAHFMVGASIGKDVHQRLLAVPHYRDALAIEPDMAEAHRNFGLALGLSASESERRQGLFHLRRALELRPDLMQDVHGAIGNIALTIPNLTAEAVESLRRALLFSPHDPLALHNLATALARMPGGESEALSLFERALALKPDLDASLTNYTSTALEHGAAARAESQLENVIRRTPERAAPRYQKVRVLRKLGRMTEAETAFQEGVSLDSYSADQYMSSAKEVPDSESASEQRVFMLRIALRKNPKLGEAHLLLGSALCESSETLPEAIQHLDAAVSLMPTNAAAFGILGTALAEREGRLEDAIRALERAAILAPENEDYRHNLEVLRQSRNPSGILSPDASSSLLR